MVCLDELPTEILKCIFEFTPSYTQKVLLRTSHRFNAITAPIFYRNVLLYVNPERRYFPHTHLSLFFRTIRNNRNLAHCVRELRVGGATPRTLKIEFTVDEIDDEEELRDADVDGWVFRAVPRPKPEMRQSGGKQIYKSCNGDLVMAVKIGRLKNLEILDLAYGIWSNSTAIPVVFMKQCLKRLKKVNLDIQPINPSQPMAHEFWTVLNGVKGPKSIDRVDLQHLLNLPHIESIACVAADCKFSSSDEDEDEEEFDEEFGPIEQPCKNLTCLRFQGSRLSQSTLGTILEAAPRLRILEYEFWIHTNANGGFAQYLDCEQMDTILEPVRDTLQQLSINIDYAEQLAPTTTVSWGGRGTMQSLATFPQLTSIEIPHTFLLGWSPDRSGIRLVDVLPRSLESLIILTGKLYYFESYQWDPGAIFDRLYDFVVNRNTHTPVLKLIEVHSLGGHRFMSHYSQLRRASDENGIRLRIDSYDGYYNIFVRPRTQNRPRGDFT
ncbi:hypothetical protein EYB26_002701 [Talaromyces marneffei]|uniref:uncharacterized protein n=1 Tax=Talaromyces marneffei TaxID=37727 RepID=UPI0012AA95EB|nr:uncharacterized protein EYB26_002701 [Talaromyces marneffei]QGA15045.1 hypothetical protein EYB26_002701 [Talaromyces marneffei]